MTNGFEILLLTTCMYPIVILVSTMLSMTGIIEPGMDVANAKVDMSFDMLLRMLAVVQYQ